MAQALPYIRAWLHTRLGDDRGAGLIEYALLVGLIAVVCVTAVSFLGRETSENYSSAVDAFSGN